MHSSIWPKSSGQCSAPASSRMTDSIKAEHLLRIELCARVHQDLLTSNSEYVNWAQHTCNWKFSLRPRPIPISMAERERERATHIPFELSLTHCPKQCDCMQFTGERSRASAGHWTCPCVHVVNLNSSTCESVFETLAAHPFCSRVRWQDAPQHEAVEKRPELALLHLLRASCRLNFEWQKLFDRPKWVWQEIKLIWAWICGHRRRGR